MFELTLPKSHTTLDQVLLLLSRYPREEVQIRKEDDSFVLYNISSVDKRLMLIHELATISLNLEAEKSFNSIRTSIYRKAFENHNP